MKSKLVLLVEDNADDEYLTTEAFRRSGIPIVATVLRDSCTVLSHLLDPFQPLPALVVLDYRMPKLGGLEVLKAIRSSPRTHFLPVVIFSSALSDLQIHECFVEGATACMTKCLDAKEYLADVKVMLHFWLTINVHPEAEVSAPAEVGSPSMPTGTGPMPSIVPSSPLVWISRAVAHAPGEESL